MKKHMGKFKFTFTNIWYFLSLVLICFLTENATHLTDDVAVGFNIPTLIILSLATAGALVMFYFINHKDNKIKADWVLLPLTAIVGISMILGIWLNNGGTYVFANGEGSIKVVYSTYEKIRATVILVLFLAFLYAMIYMVNVNQPYSKKFYWFAYIAIGICLFALVYSLVIEFKEYASIFETQEGLPPISIESFFNNKNTYGGVLFVGFLCCIIVNYYKPRLYTYLLMVVFFLGILASAAMLPTFISGAALIIYLFEEIIRFAVKKRYLKSGFATFTLFVIIALIFVMYIGCVKEWKGFNGLNIYFGELLKKKNYSTLSGRITLWSAIIPHLFDNTIHTLFGHGFLISEKDTLAISASYFSNIESGVHTVHNGFIQVIFDYGVIGAVAHFFLIGYFVYGCIRLLLEKRFHFVFVYAFVGICLAVYNVCESSYMFNKGVKEIFCTFMFIMPIISETKFCLHHERIEEIKNLPLEKKKMDPLKLGRLVAFATMGLIVAVLCTFTCTFSYSQEWLKSLLFNLFVGLSILLIFVPYLVSLYYRFEEKIVFIAHLVLNFVFIAMATYIGYLLLKYNATTTMLTPYLTPAILFVLLLLDSVFYSLAKKGSIYQWREIFVCGSFINSLFAILGGLVTGILSFVILQTIAEMNIYLYIVCVIQSLIGYFAMFYFMPTKGGREFLEDWNELNLFKLKDMTIKEEKYYG